MENIIEDTPASKWPRLSAAQKESIIVKLKYYYNELRRFPSPRYFRSLGKYYPPDKIFWTCKGILSINGPFNTEDALNKIIAQKYMHND